MLRDNEGLDFITRLPRRSNVPESIRLAAEGGERLVADLMHLRGLQRDFNFARDNVAAFPVPPKLQQAIDDYLGAHRQEIIELKQGRRAKNEMPSGSKPAHQSWSSWFGDWFGWE